MNLGQAVRITVCSVAITACVPMQPKLQELQLPPERIAQKGYSLVPMNEQGWLVAGRNQYQLALVKAGVNPDESIAIQAMPVRLPEFRSPDELISLMKEGQVKDANTQRFTIKKHEVVAYPKKGSNCAKSYLVTEDNAAIKRSARTGGMILEAMTLVCAHPKDKNFGLTVTYSHRYYPGQGDATFVERATRVFDSVEFSDL